MQRLVIVNQVCEFLSLYTLYYISSICFLFCAYASDEQLKKNCSSEACVFIYDDGTYPKRLSIKKSQVICNLFSC